MASTDFIISNFLFTALTPISNRTAESNLQCIQTDRTDLNSNTASVFMPLGGRLNGHLDIVITAAEYTSTTATEDLVIPVNPATAPIHSATATTSKITNTIRLHGENDRDFQLYHSVKKTLYMQLIASTPRTFPKKLQDHILGLGQINFLQMLKNLHETYSKINQAELDHNENTSDSFTINNMLQGCVVKVECI